MRKIFVQDPGTKLFYRDAGKWTPEPTAARDFKTSLNALAFCLQHDMAGAQIIVRFNHPFTEDIVVPVAAAPARVAPLG